jgi:hypothetical protein
MATRLALLMVSLAVAATASADPLTGVWRSERDLTLLEMGRNATLTLGQSDILSTLDFFGLLVTTYAEPEVEFHPAERSAQLSYRIVAAGSDFVEVGYGDERPHQPVRMRLLLHEGPRSAPVENLGFYEDFRRVDPQAVLAP